MSRACCRCVEECRCLRPGDGAPVIQQVERLGQSRSFTPADGSGKCGDIDGLRQRSYQGSGSRLQTVGLTDDRHHGVHDGVHVHVLGREDSLYTVFLQVP